MNPYKVLEIELEANKTEVMKAFRKKAREVHPDKNRSPEAAKEFQKLLKARDILLDGKETPKNHRTSAAKPKKPAESQKTPAEIKKEQELDRKAGKKKKLFRKESKEVKKHRQKLKTAKQRLSGKY